MDKILAKSNNIEIVTHLTNVSLVSNYLAKKILLESDLLDNINLIGKLHDIGKSTEAFQFQLKKIEPKLIKGTYKPKKNQFLHNEIGWAFIMMYLKLPSNDLKLVGNSIYWHHGIINTMGKSDADSIINSIQPKDIETMKSVVRSILGDEYLLDEPRTHNYRTPNYYSYLDTTGYNEERDNYNEEFSVVRSIIISADRMVSSFEEMNPELKLDESNVAEYVEPKYKSDNIKPSNFFTLFKNPPINYSHERLNRQRDIIPLTGKTTIVKAPAGFGKTLVGLLWAAKNNKKTIWVCPRNVVVDSVYDSIIQELKGFNINNLSVEKFVGGETIEHYGNFTKEFNSDIIVTNIDNYLKPTITDNIANRMYTINSANVVFDEYHEFVSDLALFSCFINIMRTRNMYTNSDTLLLSATPVLINNMWDSINCKTTILPDKKSHYPAAHGIKYLIRCRPELEVKKKNSELIVFNSVGEGQIYRSKVDSDIMIYHSYFIDEKRKEKYEYLLKEFGKKDGLPDPNRHGVCSSLIAQAALDVSFKHVYDSILSPETTLQRLGRCCRFGDYEEPVFTIFKMKTDKGYSKRENTVINMFYTTELSNAWYEAMSKYDGQRLTLDEIYEIYNEHVNDIQEKRQQFFKHKLIKSKKIYSNIYPIRMFFKPSNSDEKIFTSNGNKLRSIGSEIFFLAPRLDNDMEYVGLFSTQIHKSIDIEFNENGNIRSRILGSMKTIMESGYEGVDYSYILDNKKDITLEEIKRLANKSNTPYIRYDRHYDDELGLIDDGLFN